MTMAIVTYAQAPVITPHSIVNAASFRNPALPGGAIARGSLFSISGQNLGPALLAQPSSPPFETSLSGVSVKITQGAATIDAIPVSAIANTVTAIMPSNAPLGLASVQVTNNGLRSAPSPVTIVNTSFGIFANSGGQGPGTILNVNSDTGDQTLNSPSAPALPGQLVALYGTGLGPGEFPDNDTPISGDLAAQVEIFVGGVTIADKQYSGRASSPGVDQVNFIVPSDAPLGCWVPVQVRTGGAVSNAVTIAISADGSPCSEPSNVLGRQLLSGGSIGVVGLTRVLKRVGYRRPVDQTVDLAMVSLRQENASTLPFNPLFSFPPAGSRTRRRVICLVPTRSRARRLRGNI